MPHLDENGAYDPPVRELGGLTVIHDRENNTQVMTIKGIVVLPVGAEIELTEPNVNAVVTGVRLLAGTNHSPAHVCLDVRVPPEYWGESSALAPIDTDIVRQVQDFRG